MLSPDTPARGQTQAALDSPVAALEATVGRAPDMGLEQLGTQLLYHRMAWREYLERLARLVLERHLCSRVRVWRLRAGPGGPTLRAMAREPHEHIRSAAAIAGDAIGRHDPAYFAALWKHGAYVCEDTVLTTGSELMRFRAREPFAARALMDALVAVNGHAFGVLSCEQEGTPRRWSNLELNRLKHTANTVALQVWRAAQARR